MRRSHFTSFTCLACLILLTGCSGKSSSELKALRPYAKATLTAGTGLGDLQLGKTTLGWFINKIGSGRIAVLIGDETAIELIFLKGEASFLFPVAMAGACKKEIGLSRELLKMSEDAKAFLAKYPKCNHLTLSSISVGTGSSSQSDTFFQGATDRGVKLWAPITEAARHGTSLNNSGEFVAGEAYANESLDRLEFPFGIYFYYPAGAGATREEMMSGRPLSPERLREIEASAKQAAKDLTIKRMTIFRPSQ